MAMGTANLGLDPTAKSWPRVNPHRWADKERCGLTVERYCY
jgi:hypothetical protein